VGDRLAIATPTWINMGFSFLEWEKSWHAMHFLFLSKHLFLSSPGRWKHKRKME
jgi:hypothetical protein